MESGYGRDVERARVLVAYRRMVEKCRKKDAEEEFVRVFEDTLEGAKHSRSEKEGKTAISERLHSSVAALRTAVQSLLSSAN